MPEDVAKVIDHAITTDSPKLRYLVGEDAVAIVAGRQKMTDEEWIAMGKEMSDEQLGALWKEKFGLTI